MAKTKIGWTGTPIDHSLVVTRDIKDGGKVVLQKGTYEKGSILPGFTFNGWKGCEKRSRACKNCYAEAWLERSGYTEKGHFRLKIWGPAKTTPRVRTAAATWARPERWNKIAASLGVRLKVFAFSLADVGEDHPMVAPWRAEFFELVDATPHLDWLFLSKRDLGAVWPERWKREAPPNVWAGATVENQETAFERVPALLRVNARVRWLSCEPLCGPLNLDPPLCQYCSDGGEIVEGDPPWCVRCDSEAVFGHWLDACANEDQAGINWVVGGGESGPGHETMELDWLLRLHDQCTREEGIAFYTKQDSGQFPERQGRIPDEVWNTRQWPKVVP